MLDYLIWHTYRMFGVSRGGGWYCFERWSHNSAALQGNYSLCVHLRSGSIYCHGWISGLVSTLKLWYCRYRSLIKNSICWRCVWPAVAGASVKGDNAEQITCQRRRGVWQKFKVSGSAGFIDLESVIESHHPFSTRSSGCFLQAEVFNWYQTVSFFTSSEMLPKSENKIHSLQVIEEQQQNRLHLNQVVSRFQKVSVRLWFVTQQSDYC